MPNNRRRGANYEREVAQALRDLGIADAQRGARNGVAGGEDVMGWDGVRVECKRRTRIALVRALEQAERDAGAGDVPAVIAREDRGSSVLMVRLADLPDLCERYFQALRDHQRNANNPPTPPQQEHDDVIRDKAASRIEEIEQALAAQQRKEAR